VTGRQGKYKISGIMRRFIICISQKDVRTVNLWRLGLRGRVAGMVENEKDFLDFFGRHEKVKTN